ncbi:MAG: hypothetical protein IPI60_00050 [Saprospiraceae bacterium]|nr:hypothetical protein [Saprospiraceae bacterium]
MNILNMNAFRSLVCGLCLATLMCACKTASFPFIPDDVYKQHISSHFESDIPLLKASEACYVLYVYAHDTIYGKNKLEMFNHTSSMNGKEGKAVDSLFLFFVDDYRFFYSRKRPDSIELSGAQPKKSRIGLYKIFEQDSLDLINLLSTAGTAKDPYNFTYANITIEKMKDGNLRFISADYPVEMVDRAGKDMEAGTLPFDPFSDNQADPVANIEIYRGKDLRFAALWIPRMLGTKLTFKGKQIDSIEYNLYSRSYFFMGNLIATEQFKDRDRFSY